MKRRTSSRRNGFRNAPRRFQAAARRRLPRLEPLEQRNLLAGDLFLGASGGEGEGTSLDIVAIHLEATHPTTGVKIDTVYPGDPFRVEAYVEDLRAAPQGAYAAYLDLLYPTSNVVVDGDIDYGDAFTNGTSGDTSTPGIVDEVGAFSSFVTPEDTGRQLLFSIPLRAVDVGVTEIWADPADILPAHAVLMFGLNDTVSIDQIQYDKLTIEVVSPGSGGDVWVDALDDYAAVTPNSSNNRIEVIANDGNGTEDRPTVVSTDTDGIFGQVSIASDARSLRYTPPSGFQGTEQFRYTVANLSGATDTATVTVQVADTAALADQVAVQLEVTDLNGQVLTTASVGEQFQVHAYLEDLRADALGVFGGYLDLLYNTEMLEIQGPADFATTFQNGVSGDFGTAGLIDEIGAFSTQFEAPGGGSQHLFTVAVTAVAPGFGGLQADPTDNLPKHDVLVYGDDDAVPQTRIVYDFAPLRVLPSITAVDDSYHFASTGSTIELDVLENDLFESLDAVGIASVDEGDLTGSLQIAADGKSLLYTVPAGIGGTEQFTYTVENASDFDQATVTLHFEPGADADDVAEIQLEVTDLAGNPRASVESGESFLVRALVSDLRDVTDPGVFAAYFDLLYERQFVTVVGDAANDLGFDIQFGADYQNGMAGSAAVPGILDEVGAFQTGQLPLGRDPLLLFQTTFVADAVVGVPDRFQVLEDADSVVLDVLGNDLNHEGETLFRADPSDRSPASDVLLFDPPDSLTPTQIRFRDASVEIVANTAPLITAVGPGSQGGAIEVADGGRSLVYSPAPDFFGVERFVYTLEGNTQVAVDVTVSGVNDAPVAEADSYGVRENQTLAIGSSEGLLANDSDVDGDLLQAEMTSAPTHGTVQVNEDGSFSYTPDASFSGADEFAYRASDGELASTPVIARIYVQPPPVNVRLAATDALGIPLSTITAGEPVWVHALVQDMREGQTYPGVGAAYLDLLYDVDTMATVPDPGSKLGFDIAFGPEYQNGTAGVDMGDRIDDVGAFQTAFEPTGSGELELFQVQFDSTAARAADDHFEVSKDTHVNQLDVLANEVGLQWQSEFRTAFAARSPQTDVLFYDPPEVVPEEDIHFGAVTLDVSNGQVTLASVGASAHGGVVTIDATSDQINYAPPEGFAGLDSFTYTLRNEAGGMATGTATVQVVDTWTNRIEPLDVNSDGSISPIDALLVINELNRSGGGSLPETYTGPYHYDTSQDGSVSTIDVLLILNYLNRQAWAEGEQAEGVQIATADSALEESLEVATQADPLEQIFGSAQLLEDLLRRR